jgi:hypothetical protein
MKRDMDLCRAILLDLEEREQGAGWVEIDIPEFSREQITHHIRLLDEAGLIDAEDLTNMSGSEWKAKRLTWAGHEFIDAARSDTVWQKTKTIVREKTGVLTFEALKLGLAEVVKGLLTGTLHLP